MPIQIEVKCSKCDRAYAEDYLSCYSVLCEDCMDKYEEDKLLIEKLQEKNELLKIQVKKLKKQLREGLK